MNIRAKIFRGEADEPLLQAKKPKGVKADALDSISVRREERRANNGRAEDRHRLTDEHARITYDGKGHEVELINLSGGGAMVAGPIEPMLWDRVDLHLGNHGTIECVVRWVRDGRVGLEFAHETRLDWSSDEVAIVLRHVIEKTFPHIAFPTRDEDEPGDAREWTDEHRAARRHPLIWNGTIHYDYQSDPVRVRNISATGAMIETKAHLTVGSEPFLELSDSVSLHATVEWAVGDQAGLRFHSEFDMRMLAQSSPEVVPDNWTPPAYLDPDADADQDHWGRLNLFQLRDELEGFLRR
jgi:hypothetical protein